LTDIHFGRACGQPDHDVPTPPPRARRLSFWKNHNLLTFAACLFLFQLANASMLPLAGEELAYRHDPTVRSSFAWLAIKIHA
jgi:hypothetical protein